MDASPDIDAVRSALLAEIEAYLDRERLSATAFGKLAVGDGKFVARLRSGENMTTAMIKKVQTFIAQSRVSASEAA